jgi:DNA-binding NarL/FixJ family response regulator
MSDLWTAILNYFDKQSALANLVQISTALLAVIAAIWKLIVHLLLPLLKAPAQDTIQRWVKKSDMRYSSAKTLKIAIVDDEPDAFPISALRTMNFQINVFESVSFEDIERLKAFDIIFLDIRGVVKEDPQRGGFEILRRLKDEDPSPFIVAVSGKQFDPTLTEYFQRADATLKKPVKLSECDNAIQEAYANRFSPDQAAKRIDELILPLIARRAKHRKAVKTIIDLAKGSTSDTDAEQQLKDMFSAHQTLSLIRESKLLKLRKSKDD